jgi:hypothetical protein
MMIKNGQRKVNEVSKLLGEGWEIVSKTEHGTQMKRAKRMRIQGKVCMGIGTFCALVFDLILGGVLIVVPLLDYWFFTKDQTVFIANEDRT